MKEDQTIVTPEPTTKEQALELISGLYEYSLRTNGFTHPFTRDLQVWMQRVWGNIGSVRSSKIRQALNGENKQKLKAAVESGASQKQAHNLTVFKGTRNEIQAKLAMAGASADQGPLVIATIKPAGGDSPATRSAAGATTPADSPDPILPPSNTDDENPAAPDSPLGVEDLLTVSTLSAKTILDQYGEGRITATLFILGKTAEDLKGASAAQKAAMLKQAAKSNGKK